MSRIGHDLAGIVGLICVLGLVAVPTASAQVEKRLEFAKMPQFAVYVGRTGNGESDVVYLRFENAGPRPCSISEVSVGGPSVADLHIYYEDAGVSFAAKGPEVATKRNAKQPVVMAAAAAENVHQLVATDGVDPGETFVVIVVGTGDVWAYELWEDLVYGDDEIAIKVQRRAGKKTATTTLKAVPEVPAT